MWSGLLNAPGACIGVFRRLCTSHGVQSNTLPYIHRGHCTFQHSTVFSVYFNNVHYWSYFRLASIYVSDLKFVAYPVGMPVNMSRTVPYIVTTRECGSHSTFSLDRFTQLVRFLSG